MVRNLRNAVILSEAAVILSEAKDLSQTKEILRSRSVPQDDTPEEHG